MKKLLSVLIIFTCIITCVFADKPNYSVGQALFISVKSAKSGKIEFTYGDRVVIDEISGKKVLVHLYSDKEFSGWISINDLTKKTILKKTDGSNVRVSTEELSLAGKGFSESAENLYKADNPNIDFSLVDKIEEITVDENELSEFIKDGHLCEN